MRYKVGDKVRTTDLRDCDDFPIGTIGTVIGYIASSEDVYEVYSEEEHGGICNYPEDMLELYEDKNITVRDVLNLLFTGTRYELVGGRTGKRLCCSWNNKKDYIERYNNHRVTDNPIRTMVYTDRDNNYSYPVISIWVSGE